MMAMLQQKEEELAVSKQPTIMNHTNEENALTS
jgi:hypothetical protein